MCLITFIRQLLIAIGLTKLIKNVDESVKLVHNTEENFKYVNLICHLIVVEL
jgi:hypothetical protein